MKNMIYRGYDIKQVRVDSKGPILEVTLNGAFFATARNEEEAMGKIDKEKKRLAK